MSCSDMRKMWNAGGSGKWCWTLCTDSDPRILCYSYSDIGLESMFDIWRAVLNLFCVYFSWLIYKLSIRYDTAIISMMYIKQTLTQQCNKSPDLVLHNYAGKRSYVIVNALSFRRRKDALLAASAADRRYVQLKGIICFRELLGIL